MNPVPFQGVRTAKIYPANALKWFRILDPERFRQIMRSASANSILEVKCHDAYTCSDMTGRLYDLLVLCMHLLTKTVDPFNTDNDIFGRVYDRAKRTFAILSSFSSPCRELIQCGAMIALFEFGHGRVVTAYQTLSQTATLVHVIGITIGKCEAEIIQSTNNEEEENVALWWGVFILDQWVLFRKYHNYNHQLTICEDISIWIPQVEVGLHV